MFLLIYFLVLSTFQSFFLTYSPTHIFADFRHFSLVRSIFYQSQRKMQNQSNYRVSSISLLAIARFVATLSNAIRSNANINSAVAPALSIVLILAFSQILFLATCRYVAICLYKLKT